MPSSPDSLSNATDQEKAYLLEEILNVALDAIVTINEENIIVEWNNAAETIFGYTKQEALGKNLNIIIPRSHREAHANGINRFLTTGVSHIMRKRIEVEAMHSSGLKFPCELAVGVVEFKGKKYFTARIRNITDRLAYENSLKELVQELNHRVKNSLSVISSILRLTVSEDIEEYKEIVQGRIDALAAAHSEVASRNWKGGSIENIVKDQIQPFRDISESIDYSGPDLLLNPATSQSLVIVLHELCTNAVKHGALSVPEGRIKLCWKLVEDGFLDVTWKETGGPPIKEPPKKKSFGLKMIERNISAFNMTSSSTINWLEEGLCCSFLLPPESIVSMLED